MENTMRSTAQTCTGYEDYSKESDFDEYNADLVMANINYKPAIMLGQKVFPTQPPPVTYAWCKHVLHNILNKAASHVFNALLKVTGQHSVIYVTPA